MKALFFPYSFSNEIGNIRMVFDFFLSEKDERCFYPLECKGDFHWQWQWPWKVTWQGTSVFVGTTVNLALHKNKQTNKQKLKQSHNKKDTSSVTWRCFLPLQPSDLAVGPGNAVSLDSFYCPWNRERALFKKYAKVFL